MATSATTRAGGRGRLPRPEPPGRNETAAQWAAPSGGTKRLRNETAPEYGESAAGATLGFEATPAERFREMLEELSEAYPNASDVDLLMLAFCMASEATPAIASWIGQHGIEFAHALKRLGRLPGHPRPDLPSSRVCYRRSVQETGRAGASRRRHDAEAEASAAVRRADLQRCSMPSEGRSGQTALPLPWRAIHGSPD